MIPVIVNNRDLMPGKLIDDLLAMDDVQSVHLIDNASTYPPLVDWLNSVNDERIVIYYWQNTGPRAACKLVNELREEWTLQGVTHYATTDSDLDLTGIPADALNVCRDVLNACHEIVKAGCALRIDDLPDTAQGKSAVSAESRYWQKSRGPFAYVADIDTTLAVYRLHPPWDGSYGPSIRLAGQYQARHVPWYHTDENRPPDYEWYLDHADPQGTFYTANEIARIRK